MNRLQIKTATTLAELRGIKLLQEQNLKSGLTREEAAMEGFVTAEYSLDFLQVMNNIAPAIIATDGERLAGYAIAAVKSVGVHHDLLVDLFNVIDGTTYNSRVLKDANYIVVGQICVAKGYRGMGLPKKLYEEFRKTYSQSFDYCITDIAEDNPRSLAAHLKAGFKVIDSLKYGGTSWHVVLWDWNA